MRWCACHITWIFWPGDMFFALDGEILVIWKIFWHLHSTLSSYDMDNLAIGHRYYDKPTWFFATWRRTFWSPDIIIGLALDILADVDIFAARWTVSPHDMDIHVFRNLTRPFRPPSCFFNTRDRRSRHSTRMLLTSGPTVLAGRHVFRYLVRTFWSPDMFFDTCDILSRYLT